MTVATKEADEGYRQFHNLGPEWAWKFLVLKARILSWQGMDDRVLPLFAAEPVPPSSGDVAVQRLRLESLAYANSGDFQTSQQRLAEAERLCANSDYFSCSDISHAHGTIEMRKRQYSKAQSFFDQALIASHSRGDLFLEATAYLNLSFCADKQAHFDEAINAAQAAIQIAVPQHFEDLAEAALGNKAWAYYKLGDADKARDIFLDAEKKAEEVQDVSDQMMWLEALGYIALDQAQPSLAEQYNLKSLELAKRTNNREHLVNALIALAFVSEQTNKLDDAQHYADEALKMAKAEGNGRDAVYPLLVEGRVAAGRSDAVTAEADFREVEQSKDTPDFLKWEAQRALAHLYEQENHPGPAADEYHAALSTFENARCALHEHVDTRLPFLSNASRIYEDYIHFLVARGKTDEALQVADYTRARTLTEGLGRSCKGKFAPDPLNAPEIARHAGGTILFYALGQQHSYLWVITPHQAKMFPLTANQAEIDAAVQTYRKKLEGLPGYLNGANDGSVLYQMLVAPAQDFLNQPSAKNIFIIPDSGLNSLNFETLLPQPQQLQHYWIEDVTITDSPSLGLLRVSHSRNLAGKLLLIGNPVPEKSADDPYPELPNAAKQMEIIQKYFPADRQEVLARQHATPAAYLNSHPEQFSYIHFVAHGEASRTDPLDSSIILSREDAANASPSQDDSFKLYARDIINNHPLHAELVTISACYSTGKRTYSGEGLVGLSWAFLYAGAHNVVAALWDVSDASAPQLIGEFYDGLKKGKSPSEALRNAKLSLLHGGTYSRPFFWAPFQLYTGSKKPESSSPN